MKAKQKIPPNPVTQLPPTSGIIDAGLFSHTCDFVYENGKKEGDSYVLRTGSWTVFVPLKIGAEMPGLLTMGAHSRIARLYICAGLGDFKSEYLEDILYANTRAVLSGLVPEEFAEELLEEIEVETSHLPTEKTREIAFKVRDEIGVDKIAEVFGYKGGPA